MTLIARRLSLLVTGALVSFTALLASGCGEKIDAVCEEKCGADAQTCIDTGAKAEATAEERGCESEFESYVSCAGDKGVCTKGVLDATKPCAAEITALAACVH